MIRLAIPIMNSFSLYGRPERFISSREDRESLLFGLPQLPHTQYLDNEISYQLVSLNIENSLQEQWKNWEWFQVFKEMVHFKLAKGWQGAGSLVDAFKEGMLYNKERFDEMCGYEYDDEYNPEEDFEVSTNGNGGKFGYSNSPAITSDSMFIGNGGSSNGQSPNIGSSSNFLTASNANNGTTSRSRSPLPSSQGFTKNLSSFSPSISTDAPTRVVQPSKPLVNPQSHSSSSDNITTTNGEPRSAARRPTITINDEIPTVGPADISDSDDDSIYSATKGLQISSVSGSVNPNGTYTTNQDPHTKTINSTTTQQHPTDSNAPLNFSTDSFGTTSVSASAKALYGSTAKFNNNNNNGSQYNYSADSVYSHGSSNYGSNSRVGSIGHRNGSVHTNGNANGNGNPGQLNSVAAKALANNFSFEQYPPQSQSQTQHPATVANGKSKPHELYGGSSTTPNSTTSDFHSLNSNENQNSPDVMQVKHHNPFLNDVSDSEDDELVAAATASEKKNSVVSDAGKSGASAYRSLLERAGAAY
ncbi:unnamed protein product [Ambrosiozyma monospora]|uniref:Unnamed protein product n=1 Tax=Ambrosiozyma monospora TaxID=43982 RepID=A0ACB5T1J4_AMBMO|nr:unnamed protein product [Ambrosiozyma monospora]